MKPLRPSLRIALLVSLFLFVVGARWAVIDGNGMDLPNWDQWDAEGLHLLAPWYQHRLTLAEVFFPHNEHRVVLTKMANLGLTLANGQWDQRPRGRGEHRPSRAHRVLPLRVCLPAFQGEMAGSDIPATGGAFRPPPRLAEHPGGVPLPAVLPDRPFARRGRAPHRGKGGLRHLVPWVPLRRGGPGKHGVRVPCGTHRDRTPRIAPGARGDFAFAHRPPPSSSAPSFAPLAGPRAWR